MDKFWGTKSRRKNLKRLIRKIGIFIGNINIFNPKKYNTD